MTIEDGGAPAWTVDASYTGWGRADFAREIGEDWRGSVEGIIRAACRLRAARAVLQQPGEHRALLGDLHISEPTACKYERIADTFGASPSIWKRLPASWTSIYRLCLLPADVRARALEQDEINPGMRGLDVRGLIENAERDAAPLGDQNDEPEASMEEPEDDDEPVRRVASRRSRSRTGRRPRLPVWKPPPTSPPKVVFHPDWGMRDLLSALIAASPGKNYNVRLRKARSYGALLNTGLDRLANNAIQRALDNGDTDALVDLGAAIDESARDEDQQDAGAPAEQQETASDVVVAGGADGEAQDDHPEAGEQPETEL